LAAAAIAAASLAAGLACGNSAPVNKLCTPAAEASFNAYWQGQIKNADFGNIGTIQQQALTATAQRAKMCGEKP
jgi:hypothetical protein